MSNPMDERLRAQHNAALAALSPQVRAQLAQRRVAALRGTEAQARTPPHLRFVTAGMAAVCALGLGLRFLSAPPPAAPVAIPVAAHVAATPPSPMAAPASQTGVVMEGDLDFYAWLGSNDAQQVAME